MEWLCEDCRQTLNRLRQAFPSEFRNLKFAQYGECYPDLGEGEAVTNSNAPTWIFEDSSPIFLLSLELKDSEGFSVPVQLAGEHPSGDQGTFFLQISDYETYIFDLEELIAVINACRARSCYIERLEIGQGWLSLDQTRLVVVIEVGEGFKKVQLRYGGFFDRSEYQNMAWEESLDFVDSAPPLPPKRSLWRRILGKQ